MMLLAALLFFGWPAPQLEFGPPRPVQPFHWKLIVADCCGSMRPVLTGGEIIHVSAPLPRESLVGRVISNGKSLHMVTAENDRAVMTSGIANRYSDGWTPRSKIEYVVRYVERRQ